MAIRRFNYTGRQRLRREHVRIMLVQRDGERPAFNAVLDLHSYGFPSSARVFVEAYRQTSWMRFDFGTTANLVPPEDRQLSQFETPDGILFRVRVTSTSSREGLLLAEADRIPLRRIEDQEDNRIPLLATVPADLGDEVAKVDFSDRPILQVNREVGDVRSVCHLPVFAALVYPTALREILTRVLCVEKYEGGTEDETDWRSQWLRFVTLMPGVGTVPISLDDDTVVDDWIDAAVAAFSRSHQMMSQFADFLKQEGNT